MSFSSNTASSWTRMYASLSLSPLAPSLSLTLPNPPSPGPTRAHDQTTTDPSHPAGEPHQLKIEVPANRYDLLCAEGIVRALKLYLNPEIGAPNFTLKPAPQVRACSNVW